MAQEVEKVASKVVSADSDGYKSKLNTLLIEAVKEQQQLIEQKSATYL